MCTPLRASELKTTSKKILIPPFLPAKTPSKSSKKLRQKKSLSYHKSKNKKEKCSTALPTLENREHSKCEKDAKVFSKNNDLQFSSLFGKSEIKADWDTPIFAFEPSDSSPIKESFKKESEKMYDQHTVSFTASKETFLFDEKPSQINSASESKPAINDNFLFDSEHHTSWTVDKKNKIDTKVFPPKNYNIIDVVLKEEHQNDLTDICQLNLDDIGPSSHSECHVQLSQEIKKTSDAHSYKDDLSSNFLLSNSKDEIFSVSECMNENLQLTQPIPGTVVIDLEIIEDGVDNLSTGKSESAQVGIFSNNVLLINLKSQPGIEAIDVDGNTNVQNNVSEDNLLEIKPVMSALKEPIISTNLSLFQQSDSLTSLICPSMETPTKDKSAVLTSRINVSTSSSLFNTSHYTSTQKPLLSCAAQTIDPPPLISISSNQKPSLKSSPVKDKLVSLSFQQQGFQCLPELPFTLHQTSSYNPQPQTIWSSSSSSDGLLNSYKKPLVNILSNDCQINSKGQSSHHVHKMSVTTAYNKQTEIPKVENKHKKLRQILNTPISIEKCYSDPFYVGLAGKKVISSTSHGNEKVRSHSTVDHVYSQIEISKENAQIQKNVNPSITLPLGMKHSEAGKDVKGINYEIQISSSKFKNRNVLPAADQVTTDSESFEVKQSSVGHEFIKPASPPAYPKPVDRPYNCLTTTKKITDSSSNSVAIPRCVLNMDDILKPGPKENFLGQSNLGDFKTCNNLLGKLLQKESVKHRSPSPVQAVSLITSLLSSCHELDRENAIDDGSQNSAEISQPASLCLNKSQSDCANLIQKNICQDNSKVSDEVKTTDSNFEMVWDTSFKGPFSPHVKDHTRTSVEFVNDFKSHKRPYVNAFSQPLRSNPVQNKSNNKRGRKPKKRDAIVGVNKTFGNKNSKTVSYESARGWFGKGLALKRKRKL